MTVIAVKEGQISVDSRVDQSGTMMGELRKFRKVPDHLGGGYVAGCGSAEGASDAMEAFCASGGDVIKTEGRDYDLVHLRSDGSIWCSEWGGWIKIESDFTAFGSGASIAIGAMAAGATAEEAVQIACKFDSGCGGTVHTFEVGENSQ